MQRSLERLNSIRLDIGTIFQQSMAQAFQAVVLGTQKMSDIFQSFKVAVIGQFADMFAQALQKKAGFDAIFIHNFADTLPAAVASFVSKSGTFISALFNENFGAAGSILRGGLGSLGSGISNVFFPSPGGFGGSAGSTGGGFAGVPFLNPTGGGTTLPSVGSFIPGFGGQAGFFQQGSGLFGGSAFGTLGAGTGITAGLFGSGSPLARIFSGGLGAAALIPGPQQPFIAAAALIASLFGSGLFNQPSRIATEKKDISKLLTQQFGFNVPSGDVSRQVPGLDLTFGSLRPGLAALGTGFALGEDQGGIGTLKRFANLSFAAFKEQGLGVEDAKAKVLALAQAMGFTLVKALGDVKKAFEGGFGDKNNQLTLKEYNEEVKEGQKDISTYGQLLKGTFDILTGFSSQVDTAKVANGLLADTFKKNVKAAGDLTPAMKDLADQVRAGTIPIEEAINKLNEYRATQGKGALELKDFEVNIDAVRQQFVRLGVAIDDVSQHALTIASSIQSIDDQITALKASITALNDQSDALNLQKLQNAFSIFSTIATLRGKLAGSAIVAQERTQSIFPGLSQLTGLPITDIGSLKAAITPAGFNPIATQPAAGGIDLTKLSDTKLAAIGNLIDQLASNYISEANAKLQEGSAKIQTDLQNKITALQTAATAAAAAIQKALTAQIAAINKAAQDRNKALQNEATLIHQNGPGPAKSTRRGQCLQDARRQSQTSSDRPGWLRAIAVLRRRTGLLPAAAARGSRAKDRSCQRHGKSDARGRTPGDPDAAPHDVSICPHLARLPGLVQRHPQRTGDDAG